MKEERLPDSDRNVLEIKISRFHSQYMGFLQERNNLDYFELREVCLKQSTNWGYRCQPVHKRNLPNKGEVSERR